MYALIMATHDIDWKNITANNSVYSFSKKENRFITYTSEKRFVFRRHDQFVIRIRYIKYIVHVVSLHLFHNVYTALFLYVNIMHEYMRTYTNQCIYVFIREVHTHTHSLNTIRQTASPFRNQ